MSFNHNMWSQGSRRNGGTPSGDVPPFAPKRWPLKPRAKVPPNDPSDSRDAANPGLDRSESGGSSSGIHGRGRGKNGCDTNVSTQDVTEDPEQRKNIHHCDDQSEPHRSSRKDFDKRGGRPRGLRSRRRREPAVDREEMAVAPDEDEPAAPTAPVAPTASVHSAAGIHMNDFAPTSFFNADEVRQPNLPGTRPLRYITPAKRGRAGLGASRSRRLPGAYPTTSPLPCPGCQNNGS